MDYGFIGCLAGMILMLLETVDRAVALTPFFHSWQERVDFTGYLLVTVLGITLVGLLAGAGSIALALLKGLVNRIFHNREHLPRFVRGIKLTAVLIASVILAAAARPVVQITFYALRRVVKRPDEGPTPWQTEVVLSSLQFIQQNYLPLMSVLLSGLLLLIWWSSQRPRLKQSPRSAWQTGAIALGLLGLMVTAYAIDSRFFYSILEDVVHLPLWLVQILLSGLLAGLVDHQLLKKKLSARWSRRMALGLVGVLGLSLLMLSRFGENEALKALFWSRSVVARRFLALTQWTIDADGDGYSAIMGGGDCDDTNAMIHPLARDIPNNGIDENCLGGDLEPAHDESWIAARSSNGEPRTRNGNPRVQQPANIILITMDAVRADHLSGYGYHRPTSPHLDRLAQQSRLFLHGYSPGTNTGHSFAAMQRSATGAGIFDSTRPAFIQVLAQHGYSTAFFNGWRTRSWLRKERWIEYKLALLKGIEFDAHQERQRWTAEAETEKAIQYLQRLDPHGRHFAWIHYLEPHYPYQKHPQFDFGDREIDRYDSEIASTDRAVGRLLDFLNETASWRQSLIIVSSDHGEAFYDHGQREHSSKPHIEQTHVPLIIRHPEFGAGQEMRPAGLIDLGPTILRFAGIAPPAAYEGLDLFAWPENLKRVIVCETPRNAPAPSFFTFGLIDGNWKLLYDAPTSSFELYNLQTDPNERQNLIDVNRTNAGQLKVKLDHWLNRQSTAGRGFTGGAVRRTGWGYVRLK